jgi:hypothetical protein
MTTHTPQLSHTIHSLVSSRLNVDSTLRSLQQINNIVFHLTLHIGNLGPLQDKCDIEITNLIPVVRHDFVSVFHKGGGVAAFPLRIGILKYLTDIR